MRFSIDKLILWSRKTDLPPRTVEFRPETVNVITGTSRTGKSAIIPIIDYCLASERCAIPVDTIRNACSWFGLLIHTDEGKKLFARREPGDQKSTGDMFFAEGRTVSIPARSPQKNTTADAVKTRLDEFAGLTRLDFDFEQEGSGFKGRPSFRDLVSFVFQPQNVVANPDVLFFRADTYEHREKLRHIFPYVLKAISAETMAAQHELERIRRDLARKQHELQNMRHVSERWMAESRAWAIQARELGLVDRPVPANAGREQLLSILRTALERSDRPAPTAEGINEAVQEMVSLQTEEGVVDEQLRGLRRRLEEMSKLKENAVRFKNALTVQRDRLAIAKWLQSLDDSSHSCPVCESPLVQRAPRLQSLLEALTAVEAEVGHSSAAPASFDRELARVKGEIDLCLEKLQGIAIRKTEVEARSQQAREARSRENETIRFVGGLERALEMQAALGDEGPLAAEIADLQQRETRLDVAVSRARVAARQRAALEKVALFASRVLPHLDAEFPNSPIELSITDLTLRIKNANRTDSLYEIGSGANWLSYHVAVTLALQQFFAESSPSCVPALLVYDQPSQVYFPRRLAGPRRTDPQGEPQWSDEDIQAVRKVFRTLADGVQQINKGIQILVLDHAAQNVWGDIPGVYRVEEWRGNDKLVPDSWL